MRFNLDEAESVARRYFRHTERLDLESVVTVHDNSTPMAQYFVDAARQVAERAGVSVATGGYKVYTTLDPALQRAAVEALVDGTAKVEERKGYKHPTFAAAKATPQAGVTAPWPEAMPTRRARLRAQ